MDADRRHLPWDACFNARDLGGFPTRDGHATRWRTIVRADNLCRLTHHGRAELARYGVRSAIDLRSKKELVLEHDPFTRPELAEVAYLNLSQTSDAFWRAWSHELTGHQADLLTLETCRENLAAMFAAIAEAPLGAVVVYCHAGKERTGLAAALLLSLAGVDPATIAAEHARSDVYLERLYAAWLAPYAERPDIDRIADRLRTPPNQMELTLGALDEQYGGIERYLLDSGSAATDIAAVRERIVE
jgi:protein-tyrosine phosphatase